MIEFFALWGVGFWLLMGLTSIVFIIGCEKDTIGISIFATLVAVLLVGFTTGFSVIWAFCVKHIILLIIGLVAYLAIGIVNSVWRLRNMANAIVAQYNETGYGDPESELRLSRNKSKLTNWIVYWPWSVFWNLTRDFFNELYRAMSGIYQRVIDKALAGMKKPARRP